MQDDYAEAEAHLDRQVGDLNERHNSQMRTIRSNFRQSTKELRKRMDKIQTQIDRTIDTVSQVGNELISFA